jgi:hypothetical protein
VFREERVDPLCEVRDVLGQFLVLLREVGVRLEQFEELVGLGFRCSFDPGMVLVEPFGVDLVAIGLARLGEQNQRRCVSSLE